MKKINLELISFSFLLLFLSCSNDDNFRGSGNLISQNRDVTSISKIENSTSIDVIISQMSDQEVEVLADDNIINSIETIVENGVLKVDLAKGNYVDVTMIITVGIPDLEGLENTGSGNMTITGFEDVDDLVVANEGSGTISIDGSGSSLNLGNSGSGSYKGFDFKVESCIVENRGSGNCEINCTEELNGLNSGSGSIFYKGDSSVNMANSGSGQVSILTKLSI